MNINITMDSSLGWYLPTFQVLSRLAEKWRSYHRRNQFFPPKSVRRDPWSTMHIDILIDSSQCYYLPTFQDSLRLAEKWLSYRRRKEFFRLKSVRRYPWSLMHINVLIDSTQCYYLLTFQVSLRLGRRTPQKGHFNHKNQSGVTGGHPCRTGLRGTVTHPNIYPHSKFHQDWSRNDQVINCKHPRTTIDRW